MKRFPLTVLFFALTLGAAAQPLTIPPTAYRNVAIMPDGSLASSLLPASWWRGLSVPGFRSNVLHLVSSTPKTHGELVYTTCRATTNDLGGGWFYWDSTSAAATNLGTIYRTGATGRWVRVIPDNRVNVMWFGAKGDGSTDDTTNIQAAANYCYSNAATLFFPQLRFVVSDTIRIQSGVFADVHGTNESSMSAAILYTGPTNTPKVILRVGTDNYINRLNNTTIKLPAIIGSHNPWDNGTLIGNTNLVAVWFAGVTACEVYVPKIQYFGIGVQLGAGPELIPGVDLWPTYNNTFTIGSISHCTRGIYVAHGGNQNQFVGGQVTLGYDYDDGLGGYSTVTNVHPIHIDNANNLRFENINCEGLSQEYFVYIKNDGVGIDIAFDQCRYEGSQAGYGRIYIGGSNGGEGIVFNGGNELDWVKFEVDSIIPPKVLGFRRGNHLSSLSAYSPTLSLRNIQGAGAPVFIIQDPATAVDMNYTTNYTNYLTYWTGQQTKWKSAGTDAYPWMEIRNYDKKLLLSGGILATNVYGSVTVGTNSTESTFQWRDGDARVTAYSGDGTFATNRTTYPAGQFNFSMYPAPKSTGYWSSWYVWSVQTNAMGIPIVTNVSEFTDQGPAPGTLEIFSDYNQWRYASRLWDRAQSEAFLRVGGIGINAYPSLSYPFWATAEQQGNYSYRIINSTTVSNASAGIRMGAGESGREGWLEYNNMKAPVSVWTNRMLLAAGAASDGVTVWTYGTGSEVDFQVGSWLSLMNLARGEVRLPQQLRSGGLLSLDSDQAIVTTLLEGNGPIRFKLEPDSMYSLPYTTPPDTNIYYHRQYQYFWTNAYSGQVTSNTYNYGTMTFDYNTKHFSVPTPVTNTVTYTNVYHSWGGTPVWTNTLSYDNVTSPLQLAAAGTNQLLYFNDSGVLSTVTIDTNFLTFTNGILSVKTNRFVLAP